MTKPKTTQSSKGSRAAPSGETADGILSQRRLSRPRTQARTTRAERCGDGRPRGVLRFSSGTTERFHCRAIALATSEGAGRRRRRAGERHRQHTTSAPPRKSCYMPSNRKATYFIRTQGLFLKTSADRECAVFCVLRKRTSIVRPLPLHLFLLATPAARCARLVSAIGSLCPLRRCRQYLCAR